MKNIAYSLILSLILVSKVFGQVSFGITPFGTDRVSEATLRKSYGKELDRLLILFEEDFERYELQRRELTEKLNPGDRYSYVNIYLLKDYFGNYDYIIDFVEKEDASTRLDFRQMNYESLDDPRQLIAKWSEYEELSNDLFYRDEISDMDCPVFHCTWSFNHPELEPFLTYFEEHAPANIEQLARILHHSDSVQFRAASAFLLAHADTDADELLRLILPAIRDPESWVRNNSMRVIYYVVRDYEGIDVDIEEIIGALDYPSFMDRNKALVILRSLHLDNLTEEQFGRMVPILLEILEKKDAHNYGSAHEVLRTISDRDYSVDDIDGWKSWANSIGKE